MQFLITDQIMEAPESYAGGWHMRNGRITGVIRAKYGLPEAEKGRQEISWDDALEEICEDASKNSFLDVSERKRVIRLLRPHLSENRKSLICDFGASSGHMIADLQDCFSWNRFVACDLCGGGLQRSYRNRPDIMHIQMNLKKIPFQDQAVDAAVCLNVLEHIGNDRKALGEIYRVMKPGGVACFVVPYGKGLYDYYDASIYHKRRYGRRELSGKVRAAGFQVLYENYIGTAVYPFFAMKKHWNRIYGRHLSEADKRRAFEKDNDLTKDSGLGHLLMQMEEALSENVRFPFGIRDVVMAKK